MKSLLVLCLALIPSGSMANHYPNTDAVDNMALVMRSGCVENDTQEQGFCEVYFDGEKYWVAFTQKGVLQWIRNGENGNFTYLYRRVPGIDA